jgi:8-oxo-dGTP pyrophosphatase MutT (NUDIX family)
LCYLFSAFIKNILLINNRKVGLASDISASIEGEISVYKVDYFDSLLTNEIAGKACHVGNTDVFKVDFPVLEAQSLASVHWLANHIGVSTLLIAGTKEKFIYIQYQNHGNNASGGMMAPSGSGSLEWKDCSPAFNASLMSGMVRELSEELGVEKIVDLRTVVMGFFRWYDRALKPEFVGLSYTPHVVTLNKEIESDFQRFGFDTLDDLGHLCAELLNSSNHRVSLPLRVSLDLLRSIIDSDEHRTKLESFLSNDYVLF